MPRLAAGSLWGKPSSLVNRVRFPRHSNQATVVRPGALLGTGAAQPGTAHARTWSGDRKAASWQPHSQGKASRAASGLPTTITPNGPRRCRARRPTTVRPFWIFDSSILCAGREPDDRARSRKPSLVSSVMGWGRSLGVSRHPPPRDWLPGTVAAKVHALVQPHAAESRSSQQAEQSLSPASR